MAEEIHLNIRRDESELHITIGQLAEKTPAEVATILEAIADFLRKFPNSSLMQLNADESEFIQQHIDEEVRKGNGNWYWHVKN
jgi:hypothetical protein